MLTISAALIARSKTYRKSLVQLQTVSLGGKIQKPPTTQQAIANELKNYVRRCGIDQNKNYYL
jgi:hypothetical protein